MADGRHERGGTGARRRLGKAKKQKGRALQPKKDRKALIQAHKANPDGTKVFHETGDEKGNQMTELEIDDEFEKIK